MELISWSQCISVLYWVFFNRNKLIPFKRLFSEFLETKWKNKLLKLIIKKKIITRNSLIQKIIGCVKIWKSIVLNRSDDNLSNKKNWVCLLLFLMKKYFKRKFSLM